jgi:N-acetylglucosamine-6-phosphate deacetylase
VRSVGPPSAGRPDLEAGWVAPALFDLQINGCGGRGFSSETLTVEDVGHVVRTCRRHGVGFLCPTLITNGFEALSHGLRTVARACEEDRECRAAIPAIHLEGPYISPEDGPRGAHPRRHVRPPDRDEFRRLQDAAGGRIRLVTLAPEHDGAPAFIEWLVQQGVVVALGHTAASGARIREAVDAGARLSTHLGNGCHAVLPRHDNVLWEQLAEDRLWASLICDGHHLPPAVIRCMVRVKTPSRLVLTCDASTLAGLPPGRYREWGEDIDILPTGKVVVAASGYLAGSGAFTDTCVGHAARVAGLGLRDAIDMAGARVWDLLGLPGRPELTPGSPAGLMLFDWQEGGDVLVRATILGDAVEVVRGER